MRGATTSNGRPTDRLPLIGVGQSLSLWCGHERVDARGLVEQVPRGHGPRDPGDPSARRLPSGGTLSADGAAAVLSTPPVPLGPGVPAQLDDLLSGERTTLRDLVAAQDVTRLSGSATRLSISVPDDAVVGVGLTFVESCLSALATVIAPASSHGLLVRPRRGRLDVCGPYVEGPDLVAGLTLLSACVGGLLDGSFPPRTTTPDVVPSQELYGWFAPTRAHPEDEEALATVWGWARPWALGHQVDPRPLDQLVDGSRDVRSRSTTEAAGCTFGTPAPTDRRTRARELRNGTRAEPEWLTWEYAVWLVRDVDGRACRAVLPLAQEDAFLAQLDSGRLDPELDRMLRRRVPRRHLTAHAQAGDAILWHDVEPEALVPVERGPDGSVPRVSRRQARRANLHDRGTSQRG